MSRHARTVAAACMAAGVVVARPWSAEQVAVFASPRIDITDKVIKALDSGKPPAK